MPQDHPSRTAAASQPTPVLEDPPADLAQMKALLDAAALIYDAGAHGGLEAVASYRDRSGEGHEVCVNQHPDLDWRVIDVGSDGTATFVGRLEGADDLRSQAVACAQDYATQCQSFHAGRREDPPILRPKAMQMTYIPANGRAEK